MKKPQIAILQSYNNLSRLDPYLGRMGFNGEFFSDFKSLRKSLKKSVPDLLLVDGALTESRKDSEDIDSLRASIANQCSLLLVQRSEDDFVFFDRQDQREFHLVDLHDYIFENLNSYSREYLRLKVDLPTLITHGDSSHATQIISLSAGGALVKTKYYYPEEGEVVNVVISLLGQFTEVEMTGRVVYRVPPSPWNNYVQSVGISFDQPDEALVSRIQDYLSASLVNDPSYTCFVR